MVPVVWMVLLVLLVLLSLLLLLVLLAVPIVLRFYPIHRYRYLRATTRPWGQSHRRTTTKSGPQQKVTISWPSTSCCAFSCRILPSHGLAHLTAGAPFSTTSSLNRNYELPSAVPLFDPHTTPPQPFITIKCSHPRPPSPPSQQ